MERLDVRLNCRADKRGEGGERTTSPGLGWLGFRSNMPAPENKAGLLTHMWPTALKAHLPPANAKEERKKKKRNFFVAAQTVP